MRKDCFLGYERVRYQSSLIHLSPWHALTLFMFIYLLNALIIYALNGNLNLGLFVFCLAMYDLFLSLHVVL